jgi:bifunctional DNA-binding transcriptional regulator/antitoxin component of YhaV-PrlF toxin-antitoxin module
MIKRKIYIDKYGRVRITLPAIYRDKYNLYSGQEVEIDDEDGVIIIDTKEIK